MAVSTDKLSQALRNEIDRYLDGHRNRSISGLAKKASIGQSTVRRIAQGEVTPTFETTAALLGVMLTQKEFSEFVSKFYPKLGDALGRVYASTPDDHFSDCEINEVLASELGNHIYHLGSTRVGTTRLDVQRLWGEKVCEVLDQILAAEILIESEGVIRAKEASFAITNARVALNTCIHGARNFDTSLLGTEAAVIGHQTEAENREGLKEIQKAIHSCVSQISDIKYNEKYLGDIPFYASFIMNLYDKANFEEEL